jgi:hypothetical protein
MTAKIIAQPRLTSCIGDSMLDISIQSRSPIAQDTSEVLRTLTVLTVASMKVEHGVKYLYARVTAWDDRVVKQPKWSYIGLRTSMRGQGSQSVRVSTPTEDTKTAIISRYSTVTKLK